MKFVLLLAAVLAFVVVVLLDLFGGSAGNLNLVALGLACFAGAFLTDNRPG